MDKFILGTMFGIVIGLFVPQYANAEVPQDAVIKVFDASGKQIGEMSRKEYKVVKIGTSAPLAPAVEKALKVPDYNTIILHAGRGNTDLDASTNGTAYTVTDKKGPVFGATYCRSKHGGLGVCATVTDNDTKLLGVKYDFQ